MDLLSVISDILVVLAVVELADSSRFQDQSIDPYGDTDLFSVSCDMPVVLTNTELADSSTLPGLANRSVSRYGYIERQIPQYRLSLHQQTRIDSEFHEVAKF